MSDVRVHPGLFGGLLVSVAALSVCSAVQTARLRSSRELVRELDEEIRVHQRNEEDAPHYLLVTDRNAISFDRSRWVGAGDLRGAVHAATHGYPDDVRVIVCRAVGEAYSPPGPGRTWVEYP